MQDEINVPVMCLVTLEKLSHAYIQYVDTTGLLIPRAKQSQLTKEIIREYIRNGRFESVQLFALASDELIFKGSNRILQKQPLSPVKLINWWIKCLEPFKTNAYIYSPFEERSGSKRLCRRLAGTSWTYGYPWSQGSHYSSIPTFDSQDDPLWQHFECMSKSGSDASNMNVHAFWESIQLRDEFRQEPSAFITIYFGKTSCSVDSTANLSEKKSISMIKEMQSLDWSSKMEAMNSCSKVISLFTSMTIIKTRPDDEKENIAITTNDVVDITNNVQSLVRKRQKCE